MHFTNVTVEWSLRTLVFYIVIIFGCYLIACGFRKLNIRCGIGKKKSYPLALLIISTILLAVKCFNTTGRDLRTGYAVNFESATSMSAYRDQTVESGFRLMMVIVRVLTHDYFVFLFIVGALTILPVIHFIYKYRYIIDVPAAVLMYTSMYLINSFSAYRQYLAVSLSLFVLDAILEKKPYKALAWIMIASTIHITCLILVIPYVLYFAKLFSKEMITISAFVFFAALYFGRRTLASFLGGYERYSIYLVNNQVKFGMEQIVYYAPLFFLLFLCRKNHADKQIARLAYIYLLTGFVMGMLSYIVPIFGRMQSVFIPIIILIPYYIKLYKDHHSKANRVIINSALIFYCLSRFTIWITQYYNLEDLMPYTNVLGHIV